MPDRGLEAPQERHEQDGQEKGEQAIADDGFEGEARPREPELVELLHDERR